MYIVLEQVNISVVKQASCSSSTWETFTGVCVCWKSGGVVGSSGRVKSISCQSNKSIVSNLPFINMYVV